MVLLNAKGLTLEARRAYTYHGVLGRQFDAQIKKKFLTQFYYIIATKLMPQFFYKHKYKGVLLYISAMIWKQERTSFWRPSASSVKGSH